MSDSLRPHGLQPTRLLCPWNSPGKNTGVDYHSLLQRNFPNQGPNPGLLHRRQVLYHLNYSYTVEHAESSLPNWGWNLCSLLGKHRVLTSGPPGKSLILFSFKVL
ncbi:hypothetical protein R6Z07F_009729 [Ovis aries]